MVYLISLIDYPGHRVLKALVILCINYYKTLSLRQDLKPILTLRTALKQNFCNYFSCRKTLHGMASFFMQLPYLPII